MKLSKRTHLAWFLLSIWPISSFLVGFQVSVLAFYGRSQGWTLLFRKTWTARLFSRQNSNLLLDFFPPTQRRIVHWPPFTVGLEKSWNFPLQFEQFFPSLLEVSTFQHVVWPSNKLRHSLKSSLATAPARQMRLTSLRDFILRYFLIPYNTLKGAQILNGPMCNTTPRT